MVYGNQMNYGQSYSPYQQYYQNQMPVVQQSIPQIQSGLSGRIVNTFEELTVNDIPMNGTAAYFPKADMSEIECRQWKNDGTISKIVFKPIVNAQATNIPQSDEKSLETAFNEFTDLFNERLDKLEKLIKPARPKKESEEA